ncbi:Ser/Thr protein kinase [Halogeometricum pallidum JCM 14848]|uniref:Ser/Thr protein kinase n=1 Tax=Halogeometricum pallidum JCM 14848 TaxID=1227487 RepID=M0CWP0_HALPD|nr:PQQ-binding-like beta-propeller repeat protein [Halogeometricum pallidum]ELZ27038.1 Ser/Thr protein kinase [Halogeometricum pallidum JCM 14848]
MTDATNTYSRRAVLTGIATLAGVGTATATTAATGATGRTRTDPGTVAWTATGVAEQSDPVARDGYVFASTGSSVVCFEQATGERLWAAGVGDAIGPYGLAVDDTHVYAGTESGTIAAFAVRNGSERWRRTVGGSVTSLDVAGTALLYGLDGSIGALEAKTGGVRWPDVDAYDTYAPMRAGVTEGTVVFAKTRLDVTAVDLATGAERWTVELDDWENEGSTAAIAGDDGAVYLGSEHGGVVRVEAANGRVTWTADTSDGEMDTIAVADGMVVAAGDTVTIFDAETGSRVYSLGIDPRRAIAIENGEFVVAGVNRSYQRVVTGVELTTGLTNWSHTIDDDDDDILSGVAVTPSTAFVVDEDDGTLIAVRRTSETPRSAQTPTATSTERQTATESRTHTQSESGPETRTTAESSSPAAPSEPTVTPSPGRSTHAETTESSPVTATPRRTTTDGRRGFFNPGDRVLEDSLTPWGLTVLGFLVSIASVLYQNYKHN